MAENDRALTVTDSDELVVIDSDDDAAPLAPWVRTVSDQAEVADIIEIKDEDDDDDALFEKEMDVQYGSSPSRVKKEKKPKPDPSPGGGGAPQGGAAPGGHGAAAPAPAPAAAPVIGGMPTAAEKTAHLLTLPAGARDLQRMLWHIGITFKLLPHQPVAVRMVAGVSDDYPNLATNASLDGALFHAAAPTNRGGLLADVMGLGKTVEAICGAALRQAICASKNLRPLPVVIVSPNVSVLDQWSEHLSRAVWKSKSYGGSRGGVPPTSVLLYTGRFHDRVRKYNRRCQPAGDGSATWVLLTRHCLMNDVQAAMDAFSKDDEVAQVSPLFPTAEKELLEDLRDQYLAANAKLKGKNTLRQKGEGEHDVVRRLIDDYYHKNLANPPVAVIRTLIIDEAHFLRNAVSFWGIGAALAGNGAERTIMCTGTPFNNGPRDMAALQSYVDASSPAAEEKWWKEAVSGKGGPEIARAVRDWRENGGMVRRNLDVLTTQLPQLDVTTENVILDDEELFAYLPLEDSILELLKKFAECSDDDKKEKLKLFRVMMSLMALMRMWARRRHNFRASPWRRWRSTSHAHFSQVAHPQCRSLQRPRAHAQVRPVAPR